MYWFYRIGAGVTFLLCLLWACAGHPIDACYIIAGQLLLILSEICNLEETIKNDRNTKHDCDRNRGSD